MAVLAVVVIIVGVLCALDLVLTLGVIRRLREHTELLSNQSGVGDRVAGPGERVGEFTTLTVDGELVDPATLTGQTLVGFFSPSCKPCQEMVPKFVAYARAMPGGREQVLATVVGNTAAAADFVEVLSPVARVVVETADGPVGAAFQVRALPAVVMVQPDGDGRAVVTADRVDLDRPAVTV
jgi:hypothetical protein